MPLIIPASKLMTLSSKCLKSESQTCQVKSHCIVNEEIFNFFCYLFVLELRYSRFQHPVPNHLTACTGMSLVAYQITEILFEGYTAYFPIAKEDKIMKKIRKEGKK